MTRNQRKFVIKSVRDSWPVMSRYFNEVINGKKLGGKGKPVVLLTKRAKAGGFYEECYSYRKFVLLSPYKSRKSGFQYPAIEFEVRIYPEARTIPAIKP